MLQAALLGGAGFLEVSRILDGLSFETAVTPVPGAAHTLYALLWHLEFVQRQLLGSALGQEVAWETQGEWWPQSSPTQTEFQRVLRDLQVGLAQAQMLAGNPSEQALSALIDLATHSAYHWGQVVLLRQVLEDWPPT